MADNQEQPGVDPYKAMTNYYVKMKIKDIDIDQNNIVNLVAREWFYDVCPKIEMVLLDDGLFMDKYPLEDGDTIELEIGMNKDYVVFACEFTIESHHVINTSRGEHTGAGIEITAVIKASGYTQPLHNRAFSTNTSVGTIGSIMSEVGLTPDPRIVSTDMMTWYQINQNNVDFVKHVIDRSYYGDGDLVLCNVNLKKECVVTSLTTARDSEVKFEVVFDPQESLNDNPHIIGRNEDRDKQGKAEEFIYFDDFEYYDISPLINKTGAYGSKLIYNDGGEMTEVESVTDDHPFTTNSNKDSENVGNFTHIEVCGSKSDNMHANYYEAMVQRTQLLNDNFSSYLLISTKPNINVRVFDRVTVRLPAMSSQFEDFVHGGDYLVGGIINALDKDGIYTMKLVLFRNGVNANDSSMEEYETRLS